MVVGITIDEVLRDFIGHLTYVMSKIKPEQEIDYQINENEEFDIVKYFKFNSKSEMNDMFYNELSLEIFGHPDQLTDNIVGKLNKYCIDLSDDEEDIELVIIANERGRAIPSTLFFLSKLGCGIRNIRFTEKHEEMWNYADLIITATPEVIESTPTDKQVIKISSPYNKHVKTEFEYSSLLDVIDGDIIRTKTKAITE